MAKTKKIEFDHRKRLAEIVIEVLSREFPDAECALNHSTPEQLLFATILSAQCTDERVNKVTPDLFAQYPDAQSLARAKQAQVEKIIFSTGFYKNKAKSLIGAAKAITKLPGKNLPQSMEGLLKLPGVGRKTANVILGNAFGIPGLVVDTHVKRLSNLLGLTEEQDPEKIEQDLVQIVPQEHWTEFSHWLILHGRKTCIARRPKCEECPLQKHCLFGKKGLNQ